MGETARDHEGDDFHIPVIVEMKAAPGRDQIVVDHAKGTETDMGRIPVVAEGSLVRPRSAALRTVIMVSLSGALGHARRRRPIDRAARRPINPGRFPEG